MNDMTVDKIETSLNGATEHIGTLLEDRDGYPIDVQHRKMLELVQLKVAAARDIVCEYNKEIYDSR